jgi:hypothetical protein
VVTIAQRKPLSAIRLASWPAGASARERRWSGLHHFLGAEVRSRWRERALHEVGKKALREVR